MPRNRDSDVEIYKIVDEIITSFFNQMFLVIDIIKKRSARKRMRVSESRPYGMIERFLAQVQHLHRMVHVTDSDCLNNLRMDRNAFGRLCRLLRDVGGVSDGRYVTVEEQLAIFLGILAHHKKNCVVKFNFWRSGQTISHYIHVILHAIIKCHRLFLVKPTPVPDDCADPRWKWFKGCLGALDGTYINVQVQNTDKPRYRTRKGQICTNTLAVCDRNLRFVYVLPGWEGSAADGRVLRDAVIRENGLKIPRGTYYLCDNGYANSEGFLTPYKGVRYHLKEWGPESARPQSPDEMFNMRHTKARNVIERAFGIMKMRWGILRSASYYPVKVQNRLIMACFLIHNFIRNEMAHDPIEDLVDEHGDEGANEDHDQEDDYVDAVENTAEWNQFRDDLAHAMWQN